MTGEPVTAHISDMHTEIMLTIPQLTPLTISNCSIIQLDYIIEVSTNNRLTEQLHAAGKQEKPLNETSILFFLCLLQLSLGVRAFPDLTVLFPIILCDTPVECHPPLY